MRPLKLESFPSSGKLSNFRKNFTVLDRNVTLSLFSAIFRGVTLGRVDLRIIFPWLFIKFCYINLNNRFVWSNLGQQDLRSLLNTHQERKFIEKSLLMSVNELCFVNCQNV